jgi:hypothetical protein
VGSGPLRWNDRGRHGGRRVRGRVRKRFGSHPDYSAVDRGYVTAEPHSRCAFPHRPHGGRGLSRSGRRGRCRLRAAQGRRRTRRRWDGTRRRQLLCRRGLDAWGGRSHSRRSGQRRRRRRRRNHTGLGRDVSDPRRRIDRGGRCGRHRLRSGRRRGGRDRLRLGSGRSRHRCDRRGDLRSRRLRVRRRRGARRRNGSRRRYRLRSRRRRNLRRVDAGRRIGRAGDTHRQEGRRINVALVLFGVPDPELQVGTAHLRVAARADGPDRVAFGYRRPLADPDRPELRERHGPAVRGQDRHRLPAAGHGPGERDRACRRRVDRLPGGAADVDSTVLPGRIRMGGIERIGKEDRAGGGPGPRRGGPGEGKRSCEHKQESEHERPPTSLSVLITRESNQGRDPVGRCQYWLLFRHRVER